MNEKRKILEMLASGKINAEEAARLIDVLSSDKPTSAMKTKKIIFQIIQEGSDKPKVNIAIPLNLAKIGMKFIPQNGKIKADLGNTDFDFSSINWQEILEMAAAGETGELFYMEVEEDDGKTIVIRIMVE